jgi:hypothetical protein
MATCKLTPRITANGTAQNTAKDVKMEVDHIKWWFLRLTKKDPYVFGMFINDQEI